MQVEHPFDPVYAPDSRVLILGSLPSVRSRMDGFYYGHPQNRFWKLIAALTGEPVPGTRDAKQQMLLRNHIALWDVVQACDITGSSDASIRNVVPTDITRILTQAPIRLIICNGKTAGKLFQRYQDPKDVPVVVLPSTSPANAAFSLERLIESWKNVFMK